MSRSVTVATGHNHVVVGGYEHQAGDVVIVSNSEFAALTTAGEFTNGTLTDGGQIGGGGEADDSVYTQAANVAAPAAATAAASVAVPTKVEFDKVVADAAALRATVAALLSALTGAGKPMHV